MRSPVFTANGPSLMFFPIVRFVMIVLSIQKPGSYHSVDELVWLLEPSRGNGYVPLIPIGDVTVWALHPHGEPEVYKVSVRCRAQ